MNDANVELQSKLYNSKSHLQIPAFCPKSSWHAFKDQGKETSASNITRATLPKANS